jgi:hypothetical protein
MTWTSWVFGSLAAAALVIGCGGGRQGDDAGTAGAGTETGTMQGDAGVTSDTAIPQAGGAGATGTGTDTGQGGARIQRDTNNPATGSDTASLNPGDTVRPSGDTTGTRSQ